MSTLARSRWTLAVLAVSAGLAIWILPWALDVLFEPSERERAVSGLRSFASAFSAPDLSGDAVRRALDLAAQTFATAILGCALATVCGFLLAIPASHAVVTGGESRARGGARILVETARVVLDVLRGIPDFAWALLILTFVGPGALTGILAIAVSVSGILGKIFSELWDAVPPSRTTSLRGTGAGRLQVLLYGIQPHAGRAMLSFTLMRTECAVRNASVIGVVGGGGLGAAIFEEFQGNDYGLALTLLCTLLALTASTELLANATRSALRLDTQNVVRARDESRHAARRRRNHALSVLALLLIGSFAWLGPQLLRGVQELGRVEWEFVGSWLGGLLTPDLSLASLGNAAYQARIPLAMGFLATLLAVAGAALLSYPASATMQWRSESFTAEAVRPGTRILRRSTLILARIFALVTRCIPEVGWLLVLAVIFQTNATAGLLAMTLHGLGLLARVFTESVDNLPLDSLRRAGLGSRYRTWLYVALPSVRTDWLTYALFQFESNVRTSIALGMIGTGGLGFAFRYSMAPPWNLHKAGTYALAMVLLTIALDRLSRRLKRWQTPC